MKEWMGNVPEDLAVLTEFQMCDYVKMKDINRLDKDVHINTYIRTMIKMSGNKWSHFWDMR